MKIRITLYSIVFFILYVFTYICPFFTVNGVGPQLLFCGVLALCMFEKERFGAIYAIIFGLFADFASGTLFGLNTVFFILLVFACSLLFTKLLTINMLSYYICASILLVLTDMLYFLLNIMFSGVSEFGTLLVRITVPKLFITLPFMFLIYLIIKAIATKKEWRPYNEEY
ncbi:MAG: rod shape-determining protein MreD [Clostridiales bacterium]|nr:MAG: rod shape-determining protein MreD [Clostridiales bacterium]